MWIGGPDDDEDDLDDAAADDDDDDDDADDYEDNLDNRCQLAFDVFVTSIGVFDSDRCDPGDFNLVVVDGCQQHALSDQCCRQSKLVFVRHFG
jgi:hypothetical protein